MAFPEASGSIPLISTKKDLSQNDKFCGRSFFMAGRELKQLECGKVSVFGDSKADPVTKQDPMWIIFCSQLAMRFEFRKDGFSSGRFPASSKAFSD